MTRSCYLALGLALVVTAGCGGTPQTVDREPQARLTVQFRDPAWDGQQIPVDGRCRDCGGRGRSPALRIGGLPPAADMVLVEFNDLRIPDLARGGGHGTLAMATGGQREVLLPSVSEETMTLPRGVRCERPHRCTTYGHQAGAYKAPCSCGQGNTYAATVLAVRRSGDRTEILARTEVVLGVF